ncbi:MoaD/ThiS family protein [Aquimarina agarivorans]|uniref:MoaD/ThiS family protein n=1 Tax=Aquimarina agarivorans TaxID=980584 RepID=UPI000248E6D6|nr:MoaD/ThiS family protein [Aquimarina agarivorans]
MTIHILYFGLIAEAIQCSKETLEIGNDTSIKEIKQILSKKYNVLKNLSYQIAVNQKIVESSHKITMNSEIAILPPFAGG